MATCRQLITRSLRLLGVVSTGRPVPTAAEATDALESLRALYAGLIAEGVFGPISDVLTDEDYEADENERVVNSGEASISVTLPLEITETVRGVEITRPPEDRAFVLVTGTTAQVWLYDADLADWTDTQLLELDDYAPLTDRYLVHMAALLAADIAPEYGIEPPATLAQQVRTGKAILRQKRPRPVSAPSAVLRGLAQRCR